MLGLYGIGYLHANDRKIIQFKQSIMYDQFTYDFKVDLLYLDCVSVVSEFEQAGASNQDDTLYKITINFSYTFTNCADVTF